MRFAYFYLKTDEPDRAAAVVPEHVAYWRGLSLADYLGGPFEDRSGGLISFEAESADDAEQLIARDPFLQEGLLEQRWVKRWLAE